MPENRNGSHAGPQLTRPDGTAWTTPLCTGAAMPLRQSPAAEVRDQLVASVHTLVAEAHADADKRSTTNATPDSSVTSRPRITRGVKWAIGAVMILAVGLVGYGFSGSYTTLYELAAQHAVPLPRLNPIGVDGGLVGVVALDILLAWVGYPIGWLRQIARGLAAATVALNAIAGYPDPVAVALHVFAPVMILVIVEAVRVTLLRRARRLDNLYRDPVPLARWFLDPFRTPFMYRRMVLWGQTSYPAAIDLEIERRQAIMALRDVYGGGRKWRKAAPADLVWMITSGVRITDAIARVRDIVAAASAAQEDTADASTRPVGADMRPVEQDATPGHDQPDMASDTRPGLRLVPSRTSDRTDSNGSPSVRDVSPDAGRDQDSDTDTEAAALAILAAEPDISGAELGRRLGKTERHGSRLKRALSDAIHTEATGE